MKKTIVVIENHALGTYTIRRRLMEEIKKNGFNVIVLTGKSDYFNKVKQELGINIIDIGISNKNPLDIIKYNLKLYKTLKKLKPYAVLTFTIRPAIYGNISTRLLKLPTISNITGIGPLFESDNMVYKIVRVLYKVVLKKTYKIFFQNFDDLNIFIKKGFANKNQVERIPGSGIDYNKYIPIPYTKKENEKFKFLFISRLIKDKGIEDYIDAAKIILKNNKNVSFLVIGPYWIQNLKDNIITKEYINTNVKNGVINYLGEQKDIKPIVAQSDCIVLPSYREGTSNVLLEAASMEKPLISTNVTGCKEIINDTETGFLCKVKNPEDLALKMQKMLNLSNKERIEMGKKGRQKVIKEYDKQIVINAYINAIKNIK